MNLKIDIAKGGSWASTFGKFEVFFGPVFSTGLEEQQSLLTKETSISSNIYSMFTNGNNGTQRYTWKAYRDTHSFTLTILQAG